MELQSLRSQLQHACPDLKNLTNVELEESKWVTKKKVFSNLISCCRLLEEQNEALVDLHEERNAQSSFMKREGTSRDVRLESETVYRTKFMRIILSALMRLRWPPSQEAFSDPLDSLFNDPVVFRDAAGFLVKMVLPSTSISYKDREETPSTVASRPRSGQKLVVGSRDHVRPFDTSMSTVAHETSALDVSLDVGGRGSQRSRPGDCIVSSFGYEQTSLTPPDAFPGALDGSPADLGMCSARERKQALNWRAFELLQRQNELLSVRLLELQLSVLKRDESEVKMAGVISELKATIAEIVDAGSVGTSRKGQTRSSGAVMLGGSVLRGKTGKDLSMELAKAAGLDQGGSHMTNEQEMEAFRIEAEREKEEGLIAKDKSLGITQLNAAAAATSRTAGKPPAGATSSSKVNFLAKTPAPSTPSSVPTSAVYCAKCSGAVIYTEPCSPTPASGVIWSKLHGRLSALEAQWSTAQRAARSLAEGHGRHSSGSGSKHSPKAGSPPPRSGKGEAGPRAVLYSAQSTPSRGLVNRALGVSPALVSSATESMFAGEGGGGGGAFGDVYNSPPQPPSRGALDHQQHHLMVHQGGLDLARVHLLQRDLVNFAERAFAWTSESLFVAPPVDTTANETASFRRGSAGLGPPAGRCGTSQHQQHPTAMPLTEQAARRQQEALELQVASWDLLLHLAALGPVVPLALGSPLRSSTTGLEALIHEIAELTFPKISKQAQIRLQTAADRALAEQVATVRCWSQTRSCLSQWTAHAARVAPTLKMLGRRHKSNVEQAAEDLATLGSGLSQVCEALAAAEAVRIRPAGDDAGILSVGGGHSMRSGAPISPLDSLARGSAGKEVAALVNALRAHKNELGESAEIVRVLGVKLAAELKRDLDVVGSTENNVIFAADLSENVLETAQPSVAQDGRAASGETASAGFRRSSSRPKRNDADGAAPPKPSTIAARPAFDLSLS